MPREKEGMRDILADLNERYESAATLTMAQLEEYLHMHRQTIIAAAYKPKNGAVPLPLKKIGNKYIISTAAFARWLA